MGEHVCLQSEDASTDAGSSPTYFDVHCLWGYADWSAAYGECKLNYLGKSTSKVYATCPVWSKYNIDRNTFQLDF